MVGLAYGLGGIRDWETEMPFLDIFKVSRNWAAASATKSYADMVEDGDINSDGWPIRIPVGSTSVSTLWDWQDNSSTINPDQAGDFVCTYDGAGTLAFAATGGSGLTVTHTEAGRIEFTLASNKVLNLTITATDPLASGNFIRNIKLFKAENEALIDAGDVFNPRFLAVMDGVEQIRVMETQDTNNTDLGEWADRPQVNDATYRVNGVPVELLVDLANLLECDVWFTMPHLATDEYIEEFATYVEANLDAGLVAYVEWSNEIWNFGFEQTNWLFEEAGRVWGSYTAELEVETTAPPDAGGVRLNHGTLASVTAIYLSETSALAADISAKIANVNGGQIRLTDGVNTVEYNVTANAVDNGTYRTLTVTHRSGTTLSAGAITVTFIYGGSVWLHYAGKKATQMAVIWRTVFAGQLDRICTVVGTQTAVTARTTSIMAPTLWQTYEPLAYVDPTTVIDAIALTTYFGNTVMTSSTLRNDLLAQIAISSSGAMDWMKANLLNLSYSRSIPEVATFWVAQRNLSVASGKRIILYEGGQHIHHDPGGVAQGDLDILFPWMTDFCASEQMADLYDALWDEWEEFTGEADEPFMQFVALGQNDEAGSWGLRGGLADNEAPRIKLIEARKRGLPYRANCVPATLRDD